MKHESKIRESGPGNDYYKSIYEVPLKKFEECLLTNNLAILAISGFPERPQLERAWEDILREYSAQVNGSEYNMYRNLFWEVSMLQITYKTITQVLIPIVHLHLQQKVSSSFFRDQLNRELRTNYVFELNDPEGYLKNLEKCKSRTGGLKIHLDLKQIEFDGIKEKFEKTNDQEIDKNYFTNVLIILSRHNSYRITKEIMVNEYCAYLKQYNDFCEEMNKANKK